MMGELDQQIEQADRKFRRAAIIALVALFALTVTSVVGIFLLLIQDKDRVDQQAETLEQVRALAASQRTVLDELARLEMARAKDNEAHAQRALEEHVQMVRYLDCIARSTTKRQRIRCLQGFQSSQAARPRPRPTPSSSPRPSPAPNPSPAPPPSPEPPKPSPCETLPLGLCRP